MALCLRSESFLRTQLFVIEFKLIHYKCRHSSCTLGINEINIYLSPIYLKAKRPYRVLSWIQILWPNQIRNQPQPCQHEQMYLFIKCIIVLSILDFSNTIIKYLNIEFRRVVLYTLHNWTPQTVSLSLYKLYNEYFDANNIVFLDQLWCGNII